MIRWRALRTPPRGYGHPQAARGQPRDDMTPDEPGAADDENVGMLHAANSIARLSNYGSSVVPAAFGQSFPDALSAKCALLLSNSAA